MNLESWIKFVNEDQIPALSGTVQEIARLTEQEDSPLSALKDLILRDAALTANMLRLTNSAYHIPRTKKMNTIGRALVMLGFNEVRNLCMTMAVFDGLNRGNPRPELVAEMATAFHGALQARYLAVQRGDRASEEVFTAALLMHLGEMAFWCFAGDEAETLAEEMKAPGAVAEEVQMRVLGFKLSDLTIGLSKSWGLGELLEASVRGDDNPRCNGIRLGHKLAVAAETGWNSPEMVEILNEVSVLTGSPAASLIAPLKDNAREAASTAAVFGHQAAADQISKSADKEVAPAVEPVPATKAKAHVHEDPPQPDAMLQLKILRELSNLIEIQAEVNLVLELILEGIYRGIGMDTAVFALFNPERTSVVVKSALGANKETFYERFRFDVPPDRPNIFTYIMEKEKAVWIADRSNRDIKDLIMKPLVQLIGNDPFFLAPTLVNGKPIGVFFANRNTGKRELDQDAFDAFKQFTQQASVTLQHLGKK